MVGDPDAPLLETTPGITPLMATTPGFAPEPGFAPDVQRLSFAEERNFGAVDQPLPVEQNAGCGAVFACFRPIDGAAVVAQPGAVATDMPCDEANGACGCFEQFAHCGDGICVCGLCPTAACGACGCAPWDVRAFDAHDQPHFATAAALLCGYSMPPQRVRDSVGTATPVVLGQELLSTVGSAPSDAMAAMGSAGAAAGGGGAHARSGSQVSRAMRKDPGVLVGKRVDVPSAGGLGRVLRAKSSLGRTTRHVVQFDAAADGDVPQTLVLQKREGGRGHKFYVIDDGYLIS